MNNLFDLSGKLALVTGSSRGIGRAIALGLARQGAAVYVNGTKPSAKAEETLAALTAPGARAAAVYGDLADAQAAASIAEQMRSSLGLPDILVLNASYQIRSPWPQITPEQFDLQMHIDCLSSLQLIQQCVPAMREKGWGRIVTIGSVQQAKPHPEMVVYAAAKQAQLSMVRNLALQLAPYGITVNNFAPGAILTDRNTEALADAAYRKQVEGRIPAGYIGDPEDCVAPVVMLCGNGARFLTGENLMADGGQHL